MSNSLTPIYPLDQLHLRAGREIPQYEVLKASDLPEPYRTLLAHNADMTRTLERHHQTTIHLRLLSRRDEQGSYWREVAILDAAGKPVEYGASRIVLERFPEPWRSLIVQEWKPLGGILNESGIGYTSSPTAFLKILPGEYIRTALEQPGNTPLYGRQNTLRTLAGETLAEIVEILPTAAPCQTGRME